MMIYLCCVSDGSLVRFNWFQTEGTMHWRYSRPQRLFIIWGHSTLQQGIGITLKSGNLNICHSIVIFVG